MKTLWEKGKMLVTSIFSFSHNFFYPIKERQKDIIILPVLNLSTYAFNLFEAKILAFGNGLSNSLVKDEFTAKSLWQKTKLPLGITYCFLP